MKPHWIGITVALVCSPAVSSSIASAQSSSASTVAGATLVVSQRVDHVDEDAREPAIIEAPDGTLFVSGYGSPEGQKPQTVPRLWKSTDHGTTWDRVHLGDENDGALGNSDVSLAVAPDGTIYLAALQFDMKTSHGQQIAIGMSKDAGHTWTWKMISKKRNDDRPWVATAPDGTAHVIWNDGDAVYHSVSHDGGLTWSDPQIVYANAGSSHLAVGPRGEVAVRLIPVSASGNKYTEGIDLIAVSTNGGRTWVKHSAPGKRDWAPVDTPGATPRWVEPLEWDSQGALYSLWTDVKGVWLARSEDNGVTWKTYRIAEADALPYYPDLTARAHDQLAATWFSGVGESLRWHVCLLRLDAGDGRLRVIASAPQMIDSWTKSDEPDHVLVRSTAGEYVQPLLLSDGGVAVVTPIQDTRANRFGFSFWKFTTSAGKMGRTP